VRTLPENDALLVVAHRLVGVVSAMKNVKGMHRKKTANISSPMVSEMYCTRVGQALQLVSP
jgi:hypothetical protein